MKLRKKIRYGYEIVYPDKRSIYNEGEKDMEEGFVEDNEVCTVGASLARTRTTAPYESIKFSVWCSIPTVKEKLDETYQIAKEFCDEKAAELNDEIDEDLSGD